jgi:hypothetical protein
VVPDWLPALPLVSLGGLLFAGAIFAPDCAAADAALLGATPAKATWVAAVIASAITMVVAFILTCLLCHVSCGRRRLNAGALFVNPANLFIPIDLIIDLPDRKVKLCPGLQILMQSARNCLHIRRWRAN